LSVEPTGDTDEIQIPGLTYGLLYRGCCNVRRLCPRLASKLPVVADVPFESSAAHRVIDVERKILKLRARIRTGVMVIQC
jgi:hypothetical protein